MGTWTAGDEFEDFGEEDGESVGFKKAESEELEVLILRGAEEVVEDGWDEEDNG